LRCDIIQGFYYSQPLPAADIEAILTRGAAVNDKKFEEQTTAPQQH
jgi:hypothetical protein